MARKSQPIIKPLPHDLSCGCEIIIDKDGEQEERGVLVSDEIIDGQLTVLLRGEEYHTVPLNVVTPAPQPFSEEEQVAVREKPNYPGEMVSKDGKLVMPQAETWEPPAVVGRSVTANLTQDQERRFLENVEEVEITLIPPDVDDNEDGESNDPYEGGPDSSPSEKYHAPVEAVGEEEIDPYEAAPILLPQEEVDPRTFLFGQTPVSSRTHVSDDPRRLIPSDRPHIIGRALAGTGKTTTMIEGQKEVLGIKSELTLSEEQQALVEMMARSSGCRSIGAMAFTRSIADEWKKRVPKGVEAKGMHQMGMGAVMRAFQFRASEPVNPYKVDEIVCEMLGRDVRELRRERPGFLVSVRELVRLSKCYLLGLTQDGRLDLDNVNWQKELDQFVYRFEIDLDEGPDMEQAYEMVPRILHRCADPVRDNCFDQNDMIWLPCVTKGMRLWKYDLLCIDEVQDFNPMQHRLARLCGKRLCMIGDQNQSIYGFTGAMDEGMTHAFDELSSTPEGCVELPLTMTRRCGKAIVEEARKIVPDFKAHPSNGEGKLGNLLYPIQESRNYWKSGKTVLPYEKTYLPHVKPGDMVLCRVNSHLILQCNEFHRRGQKAFILGRNVGDQVMSLVKKMEPADVKDLIAKITDWRVEETGKESAKRYPSEGKLISIEAKADSILGLCEVAKTLSDLEDRVKYLFTDDPKEPGVLCTSIHKAKGLEARRVFFLQPRGGECPHPMAKSGWQRKQEMNCLYVGITRAIDELNYVS